MVIAKSTCTSNGNMLIVLSFFFHLFFLWRILFLPFWFVSGIDVNRGAVICVRNLCAEFGIV